MRSFLLPLFISLAPVALLAQSTTGWKLVWSDKFNGPAGSAPDPSKWNYDLGGGRMGKRGGGTYTSSPQSVFHDGKGNLVIRAIRDSSGN